VYGDTAMFQDDPYWRDLILFYEYFHGETGAGLGASHQTGWTGVVTKLMQQSGESREREQTETEVAAVPASGSGPPSSYGKPAIGIATLNDPALRSPLPAK